MRGRGEGSHWTAGRSGSHYRTGALALRRAADPGPRWRPAPPAIYPRYKLEPSQFFESIESEQSESEA